jgi:hypothetical protein
VKPTGVVVHEHVIIQIVVRRVVRVLGLAIDLNVILCPPVLPHS